MTMTMTKNQLIDKAERLRQELNKTKEEIRRVEDLERPYVAAISSYSGGGESRFETEELARKKFTDYCMKDYYKNGLTYGVFLYKLNEDGTKTLLENHPMGRKDFFPYQFDQEDEGGQEAG
ncbi:hypothetical protein [Metabacillus sp. SLBN-84]